MKYTLRSDRVLSTFGRFAPGRIDIALQNMRSNPQVFWSEGGNSYVAVQLDAPVQLYGIIAQPGFHLVSVNGIGEIRWSYAADYGGLPEEGRQARDYFFMVKEVVDSGSKPGVESVSVTRPARRDAGLNRPTGAQQEREMSKKSSTKRDRSKKNAPVQNAPEAQPATESTPEPVANPEPSQPQESAPESTPGSETRVPVTITLHKRITEKGGQTSYFQPGVRASIYFSKNMFANGDYPDVIEMTGYNLAVPSEKAAKVAVNSEERAARAQAAALKAQEKAQKAADRAQKAIETAQKLAARAAKVQPQAQA